MLSRNFPAICKESRDREIPEKDLFLKDCCCSKSCYDLAKAEATSAASEVAAARQLVAMNGETTEIEKADKNFGDAVKERNQVYWYHDFTCRREREKDDLYEYWDPCEIS